MTRFPTTIEHYMSSALVTVEPAWPLREAIRLMREHEFRHLPVVSQKRVVGVVSLHAAESAVKSSPRASDPIAIAAAMDPNPYIVDPEEPADRVARGMAKRRVEYALVAHDLRLVGIFTSTDALLALAALLEDELVPGESALAAPASKAKTNSGVKSASAAKRGSSKPKRTEGGVKR